MEHVFVLIHAPKSTIGTTKQWLRKRGIGFEIIDCATTSKWPIVKPTDALIILGGNVEVWQIRKHPWLLDEKRFLERAIAQGCPVFGICLGAQLLAEQLGATVNPSEQWQLGWHEVIVPNDSAGPSLTPFHCHSSTFDLPVGARRTASSDLCSNQGFNLRNKYIGFQFHTEIDWLRMLMILLTWPYGKRGQTQSPFKAMAGMFEHAKALRKFYFRELDNWRQHSG